LLLKKSIWLEGIRDKTITDDGAKRVLFSNEGLESLRVDDIRTSERPKRWSN
jgi:hypothetical protein